MAKGKKLLAITLAATLATGSVLSTVAQADQVSDRVFDESAPHAGAMIADGLIARPLLIVGTVIGTGVFVVSLPFSLLGGNSGGAFHALVAEPFKTTFLRCLGCTPVQDERMGTKVDAAQASTASNKPAAN